MLFDFLTPDGGGEGAEGWGKRKKTLTFIHNPASILYPLFLFLNLPLHLGKLFQTFFLKFFFFFPFETRI